MKKKVALTIFLLIIMITTSVFASAKSAEVSMQVVEDNICTIKLNEDSEFEKKMIEHDLTKHQVTLQLKVSNNSKRVVPSGEMMLVIDSSSSMDEVVSGTTTRKDLVLNSANKLVESLLKANPTSLKIGVTTFSTGNEKDDNGYLITGTEADAQKVCDFTNDVDTLKSKISAIEGTGQYTNLDAGLKLAKSQFSEDNTDKYMIVLTDGLPNLAVGNNDLVTYDGLTKIITETKATLTSLNNVDVYTVLTGIDNEEATFRTDGTNIYTYGQVIKEVFGTAEKPTKGKFFKINDDEIEQTITEKIGNDLLPVENALENIVVVDYFPQYIVKNFEMTYVDGIDISNISSKIDTETNSITWKIDKLSPGETAIIQYKLTLNDEFDETIIDKVLNTNEKVDIGYKDFDGESKSKTSDISPKIKLIKEDIAPTPIPKAGLRVVPVIMIMGIGVVAFLGYKARKIK